MLLSVFLAKTSGLSAEDLKQRGAEPMFAEMLKKMGGTAFSGITIDEDAGFLATPYNKRIDEIWKKMPTAPRNSGDILGYPFRDGDPLGPRN